MLNELLLKVKNRKKTIQRANRIQGVEIITTLRVWLGDSTFPISQISSTLDCELYIIPHSVQLNNEDQFFGFSRIALLRNAQRAQVIVIDGTYKIVVNN